MAIVERDPAFVAVHGRPTGQEGGGPIKVITAGAIAVALLIHHRVVNLALTKSEVQAKRR